MVNNTLAVFCGADEVCISEVCYKKCLPSCLPH